MDFSRQEHNRQPAAAAAWLQLQPCHNEKRQKTNSEFRYNRRVDNGEGKNVTFGAASRISTIRRGVQ
jgi:hypothetical protein